MGHREVEAHGNAGGGLDRLERLKELRNTRGVTDVQNAAKQSWETGREG